MSSVLSLNAIYDLKFYRKKSAWKLNGPSRQNKTTEETIAASGEILNEKYVLNKEVQDEILETRTENPLNVAFCEPKNTTKSEQDSSDVKHTLTSYEQNTDSEETKTPPVFRRKLTVTERMENLRKASKELIDTNPELALLMDTDKSDNDATNNNLEIHYTVQYDYIPPPELYQSCCSKPVMHPFVVWLDPRAFYGQYQHQEKPGGCWDCSGSALPNHPIYHTQQTSSTDEDTFSTLESSEDFMIGAHYAAHSTLIDMSPPSPSKFMFESASSKFLEEKNLFQLPKQPDIRTLTTKKGAIPKWTTPDLDLKKDEFVAGSHLCVTGFDPTEMSGGESVFESASFKILEEQNMFQLPKQQQTRTLTTKTGAIPKRTTPDLGPKKDEFVAGSHFCSSGFEPHEMYGRGRGRLLQNRRRY